MANQYRGIITSTKRVTPTLLLVRFRLSGALKYFPGQSIWFFSLQSRQFSSFQLSGCPNDSLRTNSYEVVMETRFQSDEVLGFGPIRVGTLFTAKGPFGKFWPLSGRPEQPLVWIASSRKIGTYLACVQSQSFRRVRPRQILLILEMENESELSLRNFFESKGVTVIPCVSEPQTWIDGFWGHAVDLLNNHRFKLDFSQARFFISMGQTEVAEIWNCLVKSKKTDPSQITEEWELGQRNQSEDLLVEQEAA